MQQQHFNLFVCYIGSETGLQPNGPVLSEIEPICGPRKQGAVGVGSFSPEGFGSTFPKGGRKYKF
jgi:hypothetical protein